MVPEEAWARSLASCRPRGHRRCVHLERGWGATAVPEPARDGVDVYAGADELGGAVVAQRMQAGAAKLQSEGKPTVGLTDRPRGRCGTEPVGAATLSCDLHVFVDESAKPVSSDRPNDCLRAWRANRVGRCGRTPSRRSASGPRPHGLPAGWVCRSAGRRGRGRGPEHQRDVKGVACPQAPPKAGAAQVSL